MNDFKIVVTGAMGRMGQAVVRFVRAEPDMELAGAVERPDHPDIAGDIGALALGGNLGVQLQDSLPDAIISAHAVIDFTYPEASVRHAEVCARHQVPLVTGTTGLDEKQREKIRRHAQQTPIVLAPNMSVGVTLLFHLARRAAGVLGEDYDVEIVETHHRNKVDAPSGTALRLAQVVADERGAEDPAALYDHGRVGQVGVRERGRIGLHAVRGGDVVGKHELGFYGAGEVVALSHLATSRDNFVKGALRAARWLQGKPPGLYDMGDVLGLK